MKRTATKALEDRSDVDRFARRYNAYVSPSTKYRRNVPVPTLIDYEDPRHLYFNQYHHTYVEEFVEVHMPQDSFERFMRIEEANTYDADRINHAMSVLRQHRDDERVRDDNPAVQKAWMKYLTLLELARK